MHELHSFSLRVPAETAQRFASLHEATEQRFANIHRQFSLEMQNFQGLLERQGRTLADLSRDFASLRGAQTGFEDVSQAYDARFSLLEERMETLEAEKVRILEANNRNAKDAEFACGKIAVLEATIAQLNQKVESLSSAFERRDKENLSAHATLSLQNGDLQRRVETLERTPAASQFSFLTPTPAPPFCIFFWLFCCQRGRYCTRQSRVGRCWCSSAFADVAGITENAPAAEIQR